MPDEPKNDTPQTESTETTSSTQPTKPTNNNKLLAGIGVAVGILLIALIVLVIMLLTKDEDANTDTDSDTNSSQQADESDDESDDSGREVLMRVPTSDDKFEYVVYKPQQNGSNTTIYFAVENVCEGCSEKAYTGSLTQGFSRERTSFLVDDNNGKKYSLITDEDGNELASPSCNKYLAYGEKLECFASFSKVPAGSTVSWVFNETRIDGIKVE